jgi:imidazolonepropionase-like amidohydrolase
MNRLHCIAALVILTGVLSAPSTGRAETLVIDGGTVHPMSSDAFTGRVVMRDGVIVAVGKDAAVPADAKRIDATGLHVYPGIFDAMSTLGLIEINSVSATDDQAEMGAYNPHLRAATAIHPSSEVIGVARANGLTHAMVAPRATRGGVIAGQAALVNLDGWTVEEMAINPSVAMVINWPDIVLRRWDTNTYTIKETPYKDAREEADKKVDELREWFVAAKQYRHAADAKNSRASRDEKLAALAACLDGGAFVIIQADQKRDIESAIAFAEEMGLKMILAGGADAWKMKETLAEKQIPVILGRTQSLPREEDDPYDARFAAPAQLLAAGVRIGFGSSAGAGSGEPGGAHSARTIPYEAAMATGYGLSPEDAMRAVTLWPAEILGVADKLGSLEAGKIANVIVTDGTPLEITSHVRHLIIAGREVSTDNMHRELYQKYQSRPLPSAGGPAVAR